MSLRSAIVIATVLIASCLQVAMAASASASAGPRGVFSTVDGVCDILHGNLGLDGLGCLGGLGGFL